MSDPLFHFALANAPPHPVVDLLNLTWNDLRICFAMRKMNTQLFQKYFNQIRYWNWPWISEHMALDASFIYCYCRHIDWCKISRHQRLTVELVSQFETDISWVDLSANPHLTIDMLTQFATRLDWGQVCRNIVLDEDQIEQFLLYIDWYEVSRKSPLGERFIEKYADRVHWARITAHQKLTNDFIDKYVDRVDWDYISRHRPMTPAYIQRHEKHVDWGLISEKQTLDESFILTNRNRLDWEEIAYGQPISEDFFKKHAPKTIDTWAAFTAGRRLSPEFIARNIKSLPARELTTFQSFTLAELDAYANKLAWRQLSSTHSFTQPDKTEIDEDFLRRHAQRLDWPRLVRTHVLPLQLLVDFRRYFDSRDIHQDIPLEELARHPELINRAWITQNCPLTVEYLARANAMGLIEWSEILYRHLSEEIVRAFAAELNLSLIPGYQPPISAAWISEQARTARRWIAIPEIDPRYWPLYATPPNIIRIANPTDEFFRQNRDQLLATVDFLAFTKTDILLKTMVETIHLCRPELAAQIRRKCALNELHVPSSWDYLEHSPDIDWKFLVRNMWLSETFLRRFQHKVDWRTVSWAQQRPFSEQFVRQFEQRLVFSRLQLPYDVSTDYIRTFGPRHNWSTLTPDLQEWQMAQLVDYCDFTIPPHKTLSESFIVQHYPLSVVATTQPLSESFITNHLDTLPQVELARNPKLTLSQRFIRRYRHDIIDPYWVRMSNQTIRTRFSLMTSPETRAEVSAYVRVKLILRFKALHDNRGAPTANDPFNLAYADEWGLWTDQQIPDAILRKYRHNIPWVHILQHQHFSPTILEEFKDQINWRMASRKLVLSESTIRKLKDYVHWPLICRHQKLSEDFIAEFTDRVNWEPLSPFSAYF